MSEYKEDLHQEIINEVNDFYSHLAIFYIPKSSGPAVEECYSELEENISGMFNLVRKLEEEKAAEAFNESLIEALQKSYAKEKV